AGGPRPPSGRSLRRVGRRSRDDRDALRCALRGADRSGTANYDDIDLRPQQIADQRGYRFDIIPIMAKLVGDVAPFDITEVAHPAHEFLAEWIVVRGSRPDVPDTRRLAALLRPRDERPRHRRPAESHEIATSQARHEGVLPPLCANEAHPRYHGADGRSLGNT